MDKDHNDLGAINYARLLAMALLSFAAMYALMYAMVDRFDNVHANLNQFYMAALMAAPMAPIELALMSRMYPNRKLNVLAFAISGVILATSFMFVRQQVGISDREFLKSMIPHHAAAVLMCEQAPIRDEEIQQICQSIIAGQKAEIDQMKAILKRTR